MDDGLPHITYKYRGIEEEKTASFIDQGVENSENPVVMIAKSVKIKSDR